MRLLWRPGCEVPEATRARIQEEVAAELPFRTQVVAGLLMVFGWLAALVAGMFVSRVWLSRWLPMYAIWVIETVLAGVIFYLMFRVASLFTLQRIAAVIVRHGRCAACAYPLPPADAGAATCTECGAVWIAATTARGEHVERIVLSDRGVHDHNHTQTQDPRQQPRRPT